MAGTSSNNDFGWRKRLDLTKPSNGVPFVLSSKITELNRAIDYAKYNQRHVVAMGRVCGERVGCLHDPGDDASSGASDDSINRSSPHFGEIGVYRFSEAVGARDSGTIANDSNGRVSSFTLYVSTQLHGYRDQIYSGRL